MNEPYAKTTMSRRRMMAATAAAAGCALLPQALVRAGAETLTREDEDFLDNLERSACLFFWEQASPMTGQVLDRARYDLAVRATRGECPASRPPGSD